MIFENYLKQYKYQQDKAEKMIRRLATLMGCDFGEVKGLLEDAAKGASDRHLRFIATEWLKDFGEVDEIIIFIVNKYYDIIEELGEMEGTELYQKTKSLNFKDDLNGLKELEGLEMCDISQQAQKK